MKLIRYIHPVGQGAFYTEQFFNDKNEKIATIVYDCGSTSNMKGIIREVGNMFNCTQGKQDVDILFISHFHEDHINGIAKLKELTNIKNVVIPLYNDNARLLLLSTLRPRNKGSDIYKLIESPESYFSNSRVICVKSFDGNLKPRSKPINVEELDSIIESGTSITIGALIKNLFFWEYIPYNRYYEERLSLIVNSFQISETELKDCVGNKNFQRKLKSRIPKEYINTNSMMVYSGLFENEIKSIEKKDAPNGCFYTGDAEFNDLIIDTISNHLDNSCSNIVMLQIPHHGSGDSFHNSLFRLLQNESTYPVLFLSCGFQNSYGHPSPVVVSNCSLFLNSRKSIQVIRNNAFIEEQEIRIICEERGSMLVLIFDFNNNNKTRSQ